VDPDVHQVISELYALPLADFTRARNARAAALKAADRPADALAVRELRRPPVTLWAINRLAQTDAERLATFVASVDEIRRTQLRDPRAASEAVQRQRAALDALVSRATALLAEEGQRATPAAQRRMADTLLGAAVDREHVEALTAGRLTEELPAPGFEVLTGAAGGRHLRLVSNEREEEPAQAPRGRAAERRPAAETDERRRHAAERQARAVQERERRAGERQARVAEQAERRRREAEARQAKAEQEREQHRQEAEDRQRRAAEQQAVITGLQREVDELATQLAAARERLRAARRGPMPRRPDRTNPSPKR
jgi:hypothetical protein